MTHEDRGHYAKKHPADKEVDPDIVKAIEEKVSDNKITCTAAHKTAENTGAKPGEVGFTLDMMEIRIIRCQMGIFGYKPEKKIVKPMDIVPDELESAIKYRLDNGKLTCSSAWEIAEYLGRPKMDVSSACEKLGIKIKQCQLGAF